MRKVFAAITFLTACGVSSLASAQTQMTSPNVAEMRSGECRPYEAGPIRGHFSIGLGNTGGYQDRTAPIADLTSNQTFQVCAGNFKDRTKMKVHYKLLSGPEVIKETERGTCFLFDAAKVEIQAIMGAGHTPPEDAVSGSINVCKLG